MSGESALRATPSVNIEEFERRLRATGSLGAVHDDPLAELARLLSAEDEPPPPKPVAAPAVVVEPAPEPEPEPEMAPVAAQPAPPPLRPAPRVDSSFSRVVNVDFGAAHAPIQPAGPPPLSVEPPPFVEAPVEPPPLLRAPPVVRMVDEEAAPRRRVWPVAALVVIGVAAGAGAWAYRGGVPGLSKAPPLIMAAAGPTRVQPPSQDTVSSPNDIASMIAKDQSSRSPAGKVVSNEEQPVDLNERAKAQAAADAHAATPPANPPTIAAAPLVVVAAPSPTAAPAPAPTTASTNAAAAPAPAPVVDVQPAPAPAPQPAAASAPSPVASPPPARALVTPAASPSPVAPVDSTPITPGAGTVGPTAAPPAPPTPFPEPKRVKTVSVRPDGSFIAPPAPQPDQTGSARQPLEPPTLPADPPTPVPRPTIDAGAAEPATPKLELPTKLSGKTTTRVPIAKIDTTAATTGQSPEAPLQVAPPAQESKPKRHEPTTHAAADPAPAPAPVAAPAPAPEPAQNQEAKPSGPAGIFAALGDAARGITGSGQETSAPAASVRTASAAPTATAPAPAPAAEGGGNYAVQLAAPRSEAEAQSVAGHLQSKYAGELGGMQPVIRKAEIKDKTVYRVRIANLTHAAAVSLCEKLKAAGGACFLARE
jgi:hypothetical protein